MFTSLYHNKVEDEDDVETLASDAWENLGKLKR